MPNCPHCEGPIQITTTLMEKELFSMRITWEGAFVEAITVAGIIENTRKLLVYAAKDAGGNFAAMMQGIEWGDKEATFHFLLVPKVSKPRKRKGATT